MVEPGHTPVAVVVVAEHNQRRDSIAAEPGQGLPCWDLHQRRELPKDPRTDPGEEQERHKGRWEGPVVVLLDIQVGVQVVVLHILDPGEEGVLQSLDPGLVEELQSLRPEAGLRIQVGQQVGERQSLHPEEEVEHHTQVVVGVPRILDQQVGRQEARQRDLGRQVEALRNRAGEQGLRKDC